MQEGDKWDKEIKDLLDSAQSEYDPTSWEELSKRLDDVASADDDELDDAIRDAMAGYQLEPTEDHWEVLQQKLKEEEDRRRNIYTAKLLEIALIGLVFFTLWNFRQHTVLPVDLNDKYVHELVEKSNELDHIVANIDHSVEEEQAVKASLPNQTFTNPEVSLLPFVSSLPQNETKIRVQNLNLAPVNEIPSIEMNLPSIGILPINPLRIEVSTIEVKIVADIDFAVQSVNYDGWNIGVNGSYDANFINSNVTLGLLRNQIQSGLGGVSAGIHFSKRVGPIEVLSGVSYSEKTFVPGNLTQYEKASANSYVKWQLDEVNFQQISVPLHVKVFTTPKRRNSFYLTSGISANVLLTTNYTTRQSVQRNARPTSSVLGVNVLELDKPPAGVADGGDIGENFYANAMIGFGWQTQLTDRFAFFLQPQYQHALTKNVNEVANEFNALSISAGAQFRL